MSTQDPLGLLEGYLRQDPENASLLAEAVSVAFETGRPERAHRLLDQAGSALLAHPEVSHAKATLLLSQQRFDEAALLFGDLIARGVTAPQVRFNLAYARFRQGAFADAAQIFQTLVSLDDAPLESLAYLMRCLHHAGDTGQALAAWDAASARFKTPQALGVASLVSLDTNRLDQARELADRSLKDADAPVEAMVTRATIAVGEGDDALAEDLLERAVAKAPSDGRVWSAIAAARMGRGDMPGAEQAFGETTRYLPSHVGSWHGLAWCQLLRRDFAGAQSSFETALALDRNFGETHGGLAVVAALQGREAEARQAIERSVRLDRGGLSARYAEAILGGEASNPRAVQVLAMRLLRDRPGMKGAAILERALAAKGAAKR